MSTQKITRRDFVETAAKGGAGLAALSGMGAPSILAARSRWNVLGIGMIGVGVRGYGSLMKDIQSVPDTEIRVICDLYDGHISRSLEKCENDKVDVTKEYREVLERDDIDAVIIAVPDHWHARMTVDAAEAGKDIYIEKCLCRSIPEARAMVKAVKENRRVLQLGHNGRSTPDMVQARNIVAGGELGKITYVRSYCYRNREKAEWRWYSSYDNFEMPSDATAEHIDWERFLGSAPKRPFDVYRFFHWRCYWDYGTGIAGDLLSHYLDGIQSVLRMGIPSSCAATGGIYYWKDGREVPDTWNVIYDYPDQDLAITFGCEFNNERYGAGAEYFGKAGTLETGHEELRVYAEPDTERFEKHLRNLREKSDRGQSSLMEEARTTPVEVFGPESGLDVTTHMEDFINAVRTRGRPRCNEDEAWVEAVTVIMSVIAFRERRQVFWDPEREKVVKSPPKSLENRNSGREGLA